MIVCDTTKDQTKAESFRPVSLTIEPLWYNLTLDTQVPVFTDISVFYFILYDGTHISLLFVLLKWRYRFENRLMRILISR